MMPPRALRMMLDGFVICGHPIMRSAASPVDLIRPKRLGEDAIDKFSTQQVASRIGIPRNSLMKILDMGWDAKICPFEHTR